MTLLLYLVAVAGGAASALQSAVNAQLGAAVGPINAATISTTVGLASLFLLGIVSSQLDVRVWAGAPPHLLVGGLLGAIFVVSVIYLVPKLGVVSTLMLAILGQLVVAAVVDQFGLLGNPRIEVSVTRIAGIGLVIAGFLLARSA
ncbi:MAG: DMT family transporter [Chloroflexota bacterium]